MDRLPIPPDVWDSELLAALKPFAMLCDLHDDPNTPDTSGVIFPGSTAAVTMGDLRTARRVYLAARGSKKESHVANSVKSLVDAMWQLLDDIGADGLSVCPAAKAQARIAYEPFADSEVPLAFTLCAALRASGRDVTIIVGRRTDRKAGAEAASSLQRGDGVMTENKATAGQTIGTAASASIPRSIVPFTGTIVHAFRAAARF